MTDQARFVTHRQNGGVVLTISGEVDILNSAELRAAMLDATSDDADALVVSLTDVTYFDSQTLEILVDFSKRLSVSRRQMALVAPADSSPRRLLDVSGIASIIPTYEGIDAALVGLSPSVD